MNKAANVYCTFSYFIQMRVTNQTQLPTSCFFIYSILKIIPYQLIKFFLFYTSVISVFTNFLVHHASCSPLLPFWIQLPFFLNNNPEFSQQNLKMCSSVSLLNANLSLYRIQGYHPFFSLLVTYFVSFWSILLPLRKPATSAIIPLQVMSF